MNRVIFALPGLLAVLCIGGLSLPLTSSADAQPDPARLPSAPPSEPQPRPPVRLLPTGFTMRVPADGSFSLVLIRAGTFEMGSRRYVRPGSFREKLRAAVGHGSLGTADEGPRRTTTVTRSFYLGATKVTAEQYCAFLHDCADPGRFIVLNRWSRIVRSEDGGYESRPGCERLAVNTVPWDGAAAYCAWLSDRTGFVFRLPTEAEWELAAKGEEGRKFPWGDEELGPDSRAYLYTAFDEPAPWSGDPVGSHPLNATPDGALDMIGPIAEWVADYYAPSYDEADTIDPKGPVGGDGRVLRGRETSPTRRLEQPADRQGVQGGLYGLRVVMENPFGEPAADRARPHNQVAPPRKPPREHRQVEGEVRREGERGPVHATPDHAHPHVRVPAV